MNRSGFYSDSASQPRRLTGNRGTLGSGRTRGSGRSSSGTLRSINAVMDHLTKIKRDSTHTLHHFHNHCASISARAARIQRDVSEWERAATNLQSTKEELDVAMDAYRISPAVRSILDENNRHSDTIAEALISLKKTYEYLSTHPPNPVGERMESDVERMLEEITEIAEDRVALMLKRELERIADERQIAKAAGSPLSSSSANPRSQGSPSYHTPRTPFSPRMMGDTQTLDPMGMGGSIDEPDSGLMTSLAKIVSVLYNTLDRRDLAERCTEELASLVIKLSEKTTLGPTYADDYEKIEAGIRPYVKGSHPLLKVSREALFFLRACMVMLHHVILVPMDSDFEIVSFPAQCASHVFRHLTDRMNTAIAAPLQALRRALSTSNSNKTRTLPLFALGSNCGTDLIALGLNLVEEGWHWREFCGKELCGDPAETQAAVDSMFDESVVSITEQLLEEYQTARGFLSEDYLRENDVLVPRALRGPAGDASVAAESWKPPPDCMVHSLTASLIHVLKVIFSEYWGALKVVYAKEFLLTKLPIAQEATSSDALKGAIDRIAQQFLASCVTNHCEDLLQVGECARVLAEEEMLSSGAELLNFLIENSSHGIGPNVPLFLLNNYYYMLEAFKSTNFFPESVTRPVVDALRAEYDDTKQYYVASWNTAFPPYHPNQEQVAEKLAIGFEVDYDTLCSITDLDDTDPLTKEMRMAVKRWFKAASESVSQRIERSLGHGILDRSIRWELLSAAAERVKDAFEEIDTELLFDREWSTRPQKWCEPSLANLQEGIMNLY